MLHAALPLLALRAAFCRSPPSSVYSVTKVGRVETFGLGQSVKE
jgi:hypothetical protein